MTALLFAASAAGFFGQGFCDFQDAMGLIKEDKNFRIFSAMKIISAIWISNCRWRYRFADGFED